MDTLTLYDALIARKLLSESTLESTNIESALRGRDDKRFEDRWLTAHASLESIKLDSTEKITVNNIRETAFKAVYGATSNAELAGYVSDDFELVAKALIANLDVGLAGAILESYNIGQIPCGQEFLENSSLKAAFSEYE